MRASRLIPAVAVLCVVASGLVVAATSARQPGDAGKNDTPMTPPNMTPPPMTPPIMPEANPNAVPVPDGPVLERKELDGGLVIEELKIGEGVEVKPGGAVVAHYHGTLKADPSVTFDSSFERGEPAAFPLSGVIPGWQKGVPGMKVGGVRRLIIPAALAYGDQARGEKLPANSDLVFVIQLIDALQFEDIEVGTGPEATGQFIAVTTYTIKNAAGEIVDRAEATNPYVWLPGEMGTPMGGFDAMQSALSGMKLGGKRRITIPKDFNPEAPPQLKISRPTDQKITIECQLVAVRVLPSQPRR